MKSLNIAYNPRLDQIRWLAATIVFLFHFQLEYRGLGGRGLESNWWGLVREGHTGVGLFFTLSGFLFMQIALHQQQIVYRDFVRNRFLRIFPLFLVIYLVALSIGRDTFEPQQLLWMFATNLGLGPTSATVVTGAAWTISLEFTFYLVFPFLARFAMERGPSYLVRLLVLMAFFKLACYTVSPKPTLLYFSTYVGRFDQFFVGMLAALLLRGREDAVRRLAGVLAPAALLAAVVACAALSKYAPFDPNGRSELWIWWSFIEAVVWSGVIVAWSQFTGALPAWLDRVLCHGGKISFSFYLLHMALLHLLAQRVGMVSVTGNAAADAALMLVGAYAATWGLATLSYQAIEEPFLRMRRSYGTLKLAAAA